MNNAKLKQWDGTPFDKKIHVLSRSEAKEFKCNAAWAAISVSTLAGDFPHLSSNNRRGLLRLDFWDISKPSHRQIQANDLKLFSIDQANEVISFIDENWDNVEELLVHCEAGVCRSPAIAAAICHIKYGSGAEKHFFKEYSPNRWVYRRILDRFYGSAEHSGDELPSESEGVENILDEPWNV
jgi:predicted protein tyrosine phosphatase